MRRAISYLAESLARWSARWIPSSLAIALLLTALTYVLGVSVARKSFWECLNFWAGGFWVLLEFGMQMTLILMTGHMLASAPLFQRLLGRLAELPRTPRSTLLLLAAASLGVNWIHWGIGTVVSIILVRFLALKQRDVDYRALVAVAYFGTGSTWHAGLSGSAPLMVATPGNVFEKQVGIIPLAETILTPFNLILVAVVAAVLLVLAPLLQPSAEREIVRVGEKELAQLASLVSRSNPTSEQRAQGLSHFVDHHWAVNLIFGTLGLVWVATYLYQSHFTLTLNSLNFGFFFLALLLHPSLTSFGKAAQDAVHLVHGIIIQFPLYAGIFGIIRDSGLAKIIGDAFVAVGSAHSLPLLVYYYSCVLNYFVPSGGSKFVIEAPYLISAGKALGVPFPKLILSYAWGDMTTNFLQPFWCIPLLTAANLEFKDVLGYLLVAFAISFAVVSVAIYFFL